MCGVVQEGFVFSSLEHKVKTGRVRVQAGSFFHDGFSRLSTSGNTEIADRVRVPECTLFQSGLSKLPIRDD